MSSIDFFAVRSLCPTYDYLRRLGWEEKCKWGLWRRGWCPLHSNSASTGDSFHVHTTSGQWFCHKCKVGGSVLDLACRLTRLDLAGAARQVCETMAVAIPFVQLMERRRRPRERGRGRVGGRGGAAPATIAEDDAQRRAIVDGQVGAG